MSDPVNDSLRFVVPLDLARDDDRALSEVFAGVPNGLIGSVARLLLARSLPDGPNGLDALLIEAMRDQASRNRSRGRPPGSRTARPVAHRAAPVENAKPVVQVEVSPPTAKAPDVSEPIAADVSPAPAPSAPVTPAQSEPEVPQATVADRQDAVREATPPPVARKSDVLSRARNLVALS